MDWLTFIAEIVKALAWPCASIVIAFILRKPIAYLIARLRQLRWGDWELNFFAEELKAIEFLATDFPRVPESDRESELRKIASMDPRAAITGAWTDIEAALSDLADRLRMRGDQTLGAELRPVYIARAAALRGLLSDNDYRVFAQLRELRNLAVHGPIPITKREAEEYISLASRFLARLTLIR